VVDATRQDVTDTNREPTPEPGAIRVLDPYDVADEDAGSRRHHVAKVGNRAVAVGERGVRQERQGTSRDR